MTAAHETAWERRTRRERERAAHVAEHGNRCELCGNEPKSRGLSEDHDHKTGAHRGWLCHRCNRALPTWVTRAWLWQAILYLDDETLDVGALVLYGKDHPRRAPLPEKQRP